MRPAQKQNRARGRGNRKGGSGGNNVNRVYESAGPEGKVRGTPQQIVEKYLSLARDAQTSGDRVTAENFLQHAEHYQRILSAALGAQAERREASTQDDDDDDDRQTAQGASGQANGHDGAEREEEGAEAQGSDGGDGRRRGRRRGRGHGESGADGDQARAVNGDGAHAGNGHAPNGMDPRDSADVREASAAIGGFDTIEPEGGAPVPSALIEDDPAPRRRRPRRREQDDGADVAAGGETPAEGAAPTGDEA